MSFNIVLHQPEIPQNTGNIARTCVATGSKLFLIRPLGFRVDDHNMRRAGLDYWEHLNWEIANSWEEFESSHETSRFWFFTKFAKQSYADVAYQPGDYLVFGSETRGLPKELINRRRKSSLRIPMLPEVRSLNLSNSVAIAIYEGVRQTGSLKE